MSAPVPTVRPFRALRYDATAVGRLSAVICPPYDVISPAERERLAARDPRNAVHVELPLSSGGDPYRQAAETLRAWREDGTLRRDGGPGVYVYEARFRLAGEGPDVPWRTQRGFFAVLGLEPFGAGIRPHERTFSGPREDRLRLLRATATNTSPIVVLAEDRTGRMADALAAVAVTDPTAEATDEAGVRYRIWALPADDPTAALLIAGAEGGPLTVADGHHRYETALQYRAERRSEPGTAPGGIGQDDDEGSPVDQVLVLVLDASPSGPRGGPLILPTHRLIRGEAGLAEDLMARARTYFDLTTKPPDELVTAFSPPFIEGQGARMGLLVRGQAYELTPRIEATAALFPTGTPDVVRGLDVAVLEAVLAPLATGEASTAGQSVGVPSASGRVAYTHDAQEARRAVESGAFAAAWLLQPTPVSDVLRVAATGALMPHKSTYFYPKAATGLVMFPLE